MNRAKHTVPATGFSEGIIDKIHVQPDQSVRPGDRLVTLSIPDGDQIKTSFSDQEGEVSAVCVEVGQKIAEGAPLVILKCPEHSSSEPAGQLPARPAFDHLSEPIRINPGQFTSQSGQRASDEADQPTATIYLDLDKNNSPIKIGDGQYGAVFSARGPDNKLLAVKILHDKKHAAEPKGNIRDFTLEAGNLRSAKAMDRFGAEAESLRHIREFQVQQGRMGISSIVEHVGWTTSFPREKFEQQFKALGLNLSDYALVTERYGGTLKDLLEGRDSEQGKTGYEILGQLDFETRIGTILPILQDIADGLSIMHAAGYVHLDVKPANIFWRDQGSQGFRAAIGDLGYIRKFKNEDPTAAVDVALGTLHYRSPEQKDFQDMCEVDVLGETHSDGDLIVLETADPKFTTTIVEQGDRVKFLKAWERDFQIERIERPDGVKRPRTRIYINNLDKEPFPPDFQTQVIIYKRQGIRTDLFGFGAIAYDLLTCGQSPERFYNYLVAFDTFDNDVGPLLSEYSHVATYLGEPGREPAYASIFRGFFDPRETKYAPPDLVGIVLRTMLYEAKGTYFAEHDTDSFQKILNDLKELESRYTLVRYADDNCLVSRHPPKGGDKTKAKLFRDFVDGIQKIEVFSLDSSFSLPRRICRATVRYRQLLDLVTDQRKWVTRRLSPNLEDDHFYFAELSPENLEILAGNLSYRERVSMKEYLKDMVRDRLGTVRFPPRYVSPFWPGEEIGYLRREIEILVPVGQRNEPLLCPYRFLQASPLGDIALEHDWIVGPGRKLRRVVSVEAQGQIRLSEPVVLEDENQEPDVGVTSTSNGDYSAEAKDHRVERGLYYRGIDRGSYYLDVLGRYIYQLYFVGLADNTLSEPSSVQSIKAQLKASPTLADDLYGWLSKLAQSAVYENDIATSVLLARLYRRLSALYVLLAVPDLRKRFASKEHANEDSGLHQLKILWHDLSEDIENCFALGRLFLNEPANVLEEVVFDEAMKQLETTNLNADELELSFSNHLRNILVENRRNIVKEYTPSETHSVA